MSEDRTPRPADGEPMAPEETAGALEQETAEEQGRDAASPHDMRFMVVLLVVLGLVVAAYVYNKASAPDDDLAPARPVAGGDLDTGVGLQPRLVSTADKYNAAVSREIQSAADFVYCAGGRDLIVAREPQMAAGGGADAGVGLVPGAMFEVTKRAEGIAVTDFQRRFVVLVSAAGKPENTFVFRDSMPAIGLPDGPKPSFAGLGEQQEGMGWAVIGIVHNGEAKAYPLRLMNYHEIINDTAGGDPVVVTWNPFSGAAGAMLAGKGEERLLFGSSGLAYRGDFLIYDRDTESLWSPQLGRCVAGEKTGTALQRLHVVVVPLGYWKKTHPESLLLSKVAPQLDYARIMPVPTPDYATNASRIVAVVGFDVDDPRLHPKKLIFGVLAGEKAKAYPVEMLALRGGKKPLEDTIGETRVTIAYDAEGRRAEARDGEGNQLLCTRMFWMYWQALHPDSEVYDRPRVRREAIQGGVPTESRGGAEGNAPTAASPAGSAAGAETPVSGKPAPERGPQ